MKTTLGVGAAVLAALAAEGKDFDRAELNALLDKLAASPEPKVKSGPSATCYAVAMPEAESFEYVCPACGTHTTYPKARREYKRTLARHRDQAARLKALGLDIRLDETVLCRRCTSAKDLGIPTRAKVVSLPAKEKDRERFAFKVGDEVAVEWCSKNYFGVLPRTIELWIARQYVDAEGRILGNNVNVRFAPSTSAPVFDQYLKGGRVKLLPAQAGDPADWARVDARATVDDWHARTVPADTLGEFSYQEGDDAAPDRFKELAWVVNGKRTIVRSDDYTLMRAFLRGEKTYDGGYGDIYPLKGAIARLRELLGSADK
ncbi:MAG: SH3 domain-containing protein [Kiritimatiellae bacterium]|nr:SH3 domain-containing protein [Kiritimatiellia bacterium]